MENILCDELISAVQNHDVIYNNNNHNYFNKFIREKAWNDIGTLIGLSGKKCRKRWKSIRERYVKELKKRREYRKKGLPLPTEEWEYFHKLDFLNKYIIPRPKCSGNRSRHRDGGGGKNNNNAFKIQCNKDIYSFQEINDNNFEHDNAIRTTEDTIPFTTRTSVEELNFPKIEIIENDEELEEQLVKHHLMEKRKTLDDISEKFYETLDKMQKKIESTLTVQSTISTIPANSDTDELFARTIVALLKDLPDRVKEDARAQIFNLVTGFRKEFLYR